MEKSGYDLSRSWFDFCFENPERVKPNHTALYFFCVEHCNRLGWKEKFGLPTTMAKEAIGIRSYNTYIKTLNELVDFGFIKIIEKSKNQYSSNIIALSNYNKAHGKALDKALIKHATKQRESTRQSIDSIIKQLTKNKEQVTAKHVHALKMFIEKFKEKGKSIGEEFEEKEKTVKEKEFDRFNEWVDENIPYLRKIRDQITFNQYCKITEKYNGVQMRKVLTDLANHKEAPEKYVSVNLTFYNWAKKEYG